MPEPQTLAANGTGANPLILLLLALGWPVLLSLAAARVRRSLQWRFPDGTGVKWPLLITLAVALAAILAFSPDLPVLSTYTGLAHVVSAYRVADLEWHWSFPTDYPLAVPVLVAGLVKLIGKTPAAWAAVSLFLTLLGCVGIVLLAAAWFRSRTAAMAAGIVAAALPPVLLLARADSLSVGYFALSPWVVLFTLDRLSLALPPPADSSAPPLHNGHIGRAFDPAVVGLAVGLFLIVQTRPEALAFLLIPVALPLFRSLPCSEPSTVGQDRAILATSVRLLVFPLLLALLLLVPYLSMFAGRIVEAGGELGFHLVPRLFGGTAMLAVLLVPAVLLPDLRKRFDAAAVIGGAALTVALLAAGLALFGPRFLLPGAVPWFEGGATLRTVPFWHFNPKLVPLTAIFLAAVGLCAGIDRPHRLGRIFLVLWLGGVVAAASTKATGELPFEGLRTQLPATVPFALLAGAGADRVLRGLAAFHWRSVVVAVGLVAFFPLCVPPVATLDYDQQQEYRFLARCLPELPERTALHVPADVVPVLLPGDTVPVLVDLFTLHRSGYLLDAFGDPVRGSRAVPLPGNLVEGSFFFLGLNCYRTGTTALAPSCVRVLEEQRLEPVCETTVANRPYTSDFISGAAIVSPEVRIGIYRVRPSQVGEVSNAIP